MNILLLGPRSETMIKFLYPDKVRTTNQPLSDNILQDIDFIISYRYRHIIKKDIINQFPHKIINLHTSFLPWNRGADPNLWSFLEDTPKGVSIHYIDKGIDTGRIIVQQKVTCSPTDTLRTSYARLIIMIESLFKYNWKKIRNNEMSSFQYQLKGTYHCVKDSIPYKYLLTKGWDTPIMNLIGKGVKSSENLWMEQWLPGEMKT